MIRHIPHRFSCLTMKAHNAPGLTEVVESTARAKTLVQQVVIDIGAREGDELPRRWRTGDTPSPCRAHMRKEVAEGNSGVRGPDLLA